jgi:hypothetical protein
MTRKAKYITYEERKNAQSNRDKQRKLNNEKHTRKKEKDKEYKKQRREQEKLQKQSNSSVDTTIKETRLEELEIDGQFKSRDEIMKTFARPDENTSVELPRETSELSG